MDVDYPGAWLAAAVLIGIGLGFGLMIGAFVARTLRQYMREEEIPPYDDDKPNPPYEEEP